MPPTQYQLTTGRHVEWQIDGKWNVGHTLQWPDGDEADKTYCFVEHGGHKRYVLVLPQHDRLPVYVRADLLRERPNHETLNGSK